MMNEEIPQTWDEARWTFDRLMNDEGDVVILQTRRDGGTWRLKAVDSSLFDTVIYEVWVVPGDGFNPRLMYRLTPAL